MIDALKKFHRTLSDKEQKEWLEYISARVGVLNAAFPRCKSLTVASHTGIISIGVPMSGQSIIVIGLATIAGKVENNFNVQLSI